MLAIGTESVSVGKVYQITHHENTEFRELLEQASKLLKVAPPKFVSSEKIREIPKQIMKHIEVFLPYVFQSQQFKLQPHELNTITYKPCDNVILTMNAIIQNYLASSK